MFYGETATEVKLGRHAKDSALQTVICFECSSILVKSKLCMWCAKEGSPSTVTVMKVYF